MLQTEFEFTLPKGYLDPAGNIHRVGKMRLATALDEVAPLRDPRVKENEAYLTIILLSRVITKLGTLHQVDAGVVENLFAADLAYLENLYRDINNERDDSPEAMTCSHCRQQFEQEVVALGG